MHLCQRGEYALSKDVDVVFWQDYRAFTKQQPIQDARNFVIVNSELHCKFDKFKKTEIPTQVSFIEANPLLKLYSQKERNLQIIQKYGKAYYHINISSMDEICQWLLTMRVKFLSQGQSVFQTEGNSMQIE